MSTAVEAATRRDFLAASAAVAVPLAARTAADAGTSSTSGLLAGKTAVIYGAAGAIGSAVARAIAREGARLFLAGRTFAISIVSDEIARLAIRHNVTSRERIRCLLKCVLVNHGEP